jgi:hypothetical protein
MRNCLLSFLLLMAMAIPSFAQNPFDKLKKLGEKALPDANKLVMGKEPLTTSLDDAVYEVPEMDDFAPKVILPANQLPRDNDGAFFLFPGVWEFHLKSYCMKAGTYGPSKTSGSGHVYAPLKGPKADVIQAILQNAYKHPEMKQRDIQVLIWAIIARTNLKDMPKQYMLTAAQLLSPEQLLRLNDGVLRKLSEKEMAKLTDRLPEPMKQVLEAENNMRGMMTDVNTKYEDLEKVAVLTGIEPEDEGRKVKKGRWSLTPEGYYIRYFPRNYSNMVLQIYVKEDAYSTMQYKIIKNNSSKSGNKMTTLKIPYMKLKEFDPSSAPAVPPKRGQRLGSSNDKNNSPDDRNDALDKANRILSGADNAQTALGMATDPLGTVVDQANPFSPGHMFGQILNFITDNGRKISDALNGDPPDEDYAKFAMAEPFDYKSLHDATFKNGALKQLADDFADSYLKAHSLMLALAASNDKLGGAKAAKDQVWINKQAEAIMYYKRSVGDALLTACEKWEKFLTALKTNAKTSLTLKPENIVAYQNKLRAKGFDKQELATFKFLRMGDTEIEKLKAERLAYNPAVYYGDYVELSRAVLNAWKEYGNVYSKFPAIPAPW